MSGLVLPNVFVIRSLSLATSRHVRTRSTQIFPPTFAIVCEIVRWGPRTSSHAKQQQQYIFSPPALSALSARLKAGQEMPGLCAFVLLVLRATRPKSHILCFDPKLNSHRIFLAAGGKRKRRNLPLGPRNGFRHLARIVAETTFVNLVTSLDSGASHGLVAAAFVPSWAATRAPTTRTRSARRA